MKEREKPCNAKAKEEEREKPCKETNKEKTRSSPVVGRRDKRREFF